MAARRLIKQNFAPFATSAVIAGTALLPRTNLHAESPLKKPIYDDNDISHSHNQSLASSSETTQTFTKLKSPTPTDRLAAKIGNARLFLHAHVSYLEDKVNGFMDSAFKLEESFTSTIASLAPGPQSGEKLMPGSLYVLVAAMTGSIITRRRNIMLRTTLPLVTGIISGWILLPVTSRNISELVWKYEQRFPVIADSHIRSKEAINKAQSMAKIHSQQAIHILNEKFSSGRNAIEDWVKKGK